MGTTRKNKLINFLNLDLKRGGTSDRFPIRFCFANLDKNFYSDFLSVSNSFTNFYYYNFSKVLSDKNLWILRHNAYNKIYNDIMLDNKNYIVFGLSEFLRFTTKKELEKIITQLNGLENITKNNKKRVIFVFDSLFNEIREILKNTNQRSDFFDPIIDLTNTNESRSILYPQLIVNCDTPTSILTTVKDYLDCQTNFYRYNTEKLTCSSKIIQNLIKQYCDFLEDQDFKYIDLSNPIKIISETLQIPENNIQKIDTNLLSQLSKLIIEFQIDNFKKLVEKYLNEKIDDNKIIKYLFLTDNKELFNIALFYISLNQDNILEYAYLYKLIKDFNDYSFLYKNRTYLIENIVLSFSSSDVIDIFSEVRKKMINFLLENSLIEINYLYSESKYESIFENFITNYIKDIFPWINLSKYSDKIKFTEDFAKQLSELNRQDQIDNLKNRLNQIFKKVILGKLDIEKEIMIKLFSVDFIDVNFLKENYIDLYLYLEPSQNINFGDKNKTFNYIQNYLNEYKISKVKNKISNHLREYYENFNIENYYENINSINDIRKTNIEISPDIVFVIDGMGAEYYDFLISKIHILYNKAPIYKSIRRSLLPSTTSINKDYISKIYEANNIQWIDKLDSKIIHGDHYSWPKNIINSLNLITQIIEENIKNHTQSSFIIIADHGSTIAPILYKHEKINNFTNAEHEGRCMKINNQNFVDNIEKGFIVNNDYLISINYMSLNNRPSHEAHGGGTFEEILVPYLYYTPENLNYLIRFDKDNINGINHDIIFRISPDISLSNISIIDNKNRTIPIKKDNNQFIATLFDGSTQDIEITISGKTFKFTIKNNSFITNDEGDLF